MRHLITCFLCCIDYVVVNHYFPRREHLLGLRDELQEILGKGKRYPLKRREHFPNVDQVRYYDYLLCVVLDELLGFFLFRRPFSIFTVTTLSMIDMNPS